MHIAHNNINVIFFLFSNTLILLAKAPKQYRTINQIGEYPFNDTNGSPKHPITENNIKIIINAFSCVFCLY